MVNFDFDEIEKELALVVPNIYRMFIKAVSDGGYDLRRFRIYHDTKTLIKGNWLKRNDFAESDPKWCHHFLDFGVGDGCGNYFFLQATDEDDDIVQLLAHDPPGIEDVGSGTIFLQDLFAELKVGFLGPNRYAFDGSRYWD